jgi:2'-5' RNA ligase
MSEAGERWRVFCAIEVPAAVSQLAAGHITQLRKEFPDVSASWNRDTNFHLTIKFIGETPRARVHAVSQAAERAASTCSHFDLAVSGAGAFPGHGPPKVLWLGIDDPAGHQLRGLQARLEEECAGEGFAREERPFHPHLTVARLRRPAGTKKLAAAHKEMGFSPIAFQVTELLVIRSELSSQGSKYTTVSRHRLK